MNKNIFIGGIVLVLALIGAYIFTTQRPVTTTANQFTPDTVSAGATTAEPTPVQPTQGEPATETPGKPIPTTNAKVAPTDTTVVVTGTVVPKGSITTYWYEYGTTKALGKKTTTQVVGSGFVAIPTPGYITGLAKNTTYYFQLVAENEFGRVNGEQNSVTTTEITATPVGAIPTLSTQAATGISETQASFKGRVNPNKASTQFWFEYGTQGSLGSVTTFTSIGDGSAILDASAAITNLQPGTTYYYRINAQNQFGTVNGAILTLKTAGKAVTTVSVPVVTTQLANLVGSTTATVRGTVNPYGTKTSYYFEYSTDAGYTKATTNSTAQKPAGQISSTVAVQANITGLKPATTYFVRIVAENPGGKVMGESQTFKTK